MESLWDFSRRVNSVIQVLTEINAEGTREENSRIDTAIIYLRLCRSAIQKSLKDTVEAFLCDARITNTEQGLLSYALLEISARRTKIVNSVLREGLVDIDLKFAANCRSLAELEDALLLLLTIKVLKGSI